MIGPGCHGDHLTFCVKPLMRDSLINILFTRELFHIIVAKYFSCWLSCLWWRAGVRHQRKIIGLLFVFIFMVPFMSAIQAAETTAYSYDARGRVATVCFVESGRLVTYGYDAAGNRTSVATTGTSCGAVPPPPNRPPVAVNDTFTGYFTVYDWVYVHVLNNDSDPDGDPLTVTGATCVYNGCIVSVDSNTLSIMGTTIGDKLVTYTISDGRGGTASANVTIKTFYAGAGCPDPNSPCIPTGPGNF